MTGSVASLPAPQVCVACVPSSLSVEPCMPMWFVNESNKWFLARFLLKQQLHTLRVTRPFRACLGLCPQTIVTLDSLTKSPVYNLNGLSCYCSTRNAWSSKDWYIPYHQCWGDIDNILWCYWMDDFYMSDFWGYTTQTADEFHFSGKRLIVWSPKRILSQSSVVHKPKKVGACSSANTSKCGRPITEHWSYGHYCQIVLAFNNSNIECCPQ